MLDQRGRLLLAAVGAVLVRVVAFGDGPPAIPTEALMRLIGLVIASIRPAKTRR